MVALITEELLLPWMCWYMPFKVSALFERRCTLVLTEWFFYLNVWACVIWDNQLRRMNSCTDHRWNASPLNAVLTCVVWGDSFVWRMTYTECNLMLFPLSEWEHASWGNLPLCRNSRTVCNYTAYLLSLMDSHVASKVASPSARVVALTADKRFLSAMNSHVVFQHGRCVRWEAALVAFVSFLYIRMDLVEFGYLEKFWLMIYVFKVCWGLQLIGIIVKNVVIWPELFCKKWKWRDWKFILITWQ